MLQQDPGGERPVVIVVVFPSIPLSGLCVLGHCTMTSNSSLWSFSVFCVCDQVLERVGITLITNTPRIPAAQKRVAL